MIYELRTYTIVPGKQAEYLKVQGEVGRRIRGDRYGKFEGGWTTEFGTLNQYVHLWSYADAGERQRLRAGLAQDSGWVNEYLPLIKPLLLAQQTKILTPVDGVPFAPPGAGKHVYELRSYRAQFQRLGEWLSLLKSVLPAREEYSKIVGLWTTDVGQLNQAVHLWAYDDLNHRAEVRSRVLQDPRWQEFLPKAAACLVEMESQILIPTASSPLQ